MRRAEQGDRDFWHRVAMILADEVAWDADDPDATASRIAGRDKRDHPWPSEVRMAGSLIRAAGVFRRRAEMDFVEAIEDDPEREDVAA